MTCEYCGAAPAPYRITEEDGQRIFLCAECREDVEYCARGGKPEPERNEPVDEVEPQADCGIAEPHAPGMHPPAFDLMESYEEPDETAAGRTVREGTDRSFLDGEDEELGEVGQGIAQRAAEARARIFGREHYPALIAVAALASLGLTIYFFAEGHWLLALLV